MRNKILLMLLAAFITLSATAQSGKFNYQGIARNNDGSPMANQNISIRISILDGAAVGPSLYSELHSVTTNAYGLYTTVIGDGTVASGDITTIDWGADSRFIQVEIDPAGGTAYQNLGTKELLSVPYAMYAFDGNNKTKITAITAPAGQQLASATTIYTKIADLGTFTKDRADSKVEITFSSNFRMGSKSDASTAAYYQIRVDDMQTTTGIGVLALKETAINMPGLIQAIFTNLGTGTHTISIWGRVTYGTAGNMYFNSGNYSADKQVIVKEFD